MMFPSLYEELDMTRYARMVKDMLPQQNIMLALCDDTGQIAWSDVAEKEQAEVLINSDAREYSGNPNHVCDFIERDYHGKKVVYYHLGELSGRSVGELVFYIMDDVIVDEVMSKKITSMMCNMAATVKAELYYLYEVSSMAKELGDCYDELSVLRSSETALTEHHETRHILSTYIRNYAEHLDLDCAAIWVPSRKAIYPAGVSYKNSSTKTLALLERSSQAAYKLFQSGHEAFGINSNNDNDLRSQLQLTDSYKALFVPVLDEKNKPCGVLVCLNEAHRNDFSSNNQATLEIIARKIYRYLQDTQDTVTGLLNRKGFEESVWREIVQTKSEKHLVLFNINQFSVINAAYGTVGGDIVLSSIANTILDGTHELKFVARLDADVFAGLIETPKSDVKDLVTEICEEIDELEVLIDDKKVTVNSRAGVIVVNSKETEVSDHLYAAELALTSAKENHGEQVVVYKPGNTALLKQRYQLTQVENIKHALQEDRFELHCQRIEPTLRDEVHYEILVRMISELGELIAPDEFIPVAERYNLMGAIDRWVIKNTFKLLRKKEYREISTQFIWGINLSGMTISDPDFHQYVSDCLREYDFPPSNLYFEITETAAIKNFQSCVSFMHKIHSLGVQFALDDFGSGLSSFGYLKKLSIDYLKIDGSLVRDVVNSNLDQTMISAVIDIAKVMNVKTIAEYVENKPILKKLKGLNIDYVQGYEIMKPHPFGLELKSLASSTEYKLSSNS